MNEELLESVGERFHSYYKWLENNKEKLLTPKEIEKHVYDWTRLVLSLGLLHSYYGKTPLKVLELGGVGVSTKLIKSFFPAWQVENYSEDLRKPNWNIPSKTFDLIISMEVLEHLTDIHQEDFEWNASFVYSGALNCLLESRRVLKDDGKIFLSTPNGNCYLNIYKILKGEIPHQYIPHVREYTHSELVDLIHRAQLKICNDDCLEALCPTWDFSRIKNFLEQENCPCDNRNSTFYFNLSK